MTTNILMYFIPGISFLGLWVSRASWLAQMIKNLPAVQEAGVWPLGWEEPLEKGMATHSSILAWRIPWPEELHGLQCMGVAESDATEWFPSLTLMCNTVLQLWYTIYYEVQYWFSYYIIFKGKDTFLFLIKMAIMYYFLLTKFEVNFPSHSKVSSKFLLANHSCTDRPY